MGESLRATRLRQEVMRLSGMGWELRERTRFEATMAYQLPPRLLDVIELVIGLIAGGGGSPEMRVRELRLTVDDDGVIHRRTISELPPRNRRRGRAWEVEDTDGPAVRQTYDDFGPQAS